MLILELYFNSISVLFGLASMRKVFINYFHAIANVYRLRVMQFIIFQQLSFVLVQQADWAASSQTLLRSRRRMS